MKLVELHHVRIAAARPGVRLEAAVEAAKGADFLHFNDRLIPMTATWVEILDGHCLAEFPEVRMPWQRPKKDEMYWYEVVVGNIGTVYNGRNVVEARKAYDAYTAISKDGIGRAAGEPVTMLRNGEIRREWQRVFSEQEDKNGEDA